MASFVAQPVLDPLESRPAPERLNVADGALLTQDHFRAEQLYHRGQIARLALHLHGAGTVAGLDVSYAPTMGPEVEVRVAPGLAVDRLGRLVELPYLSCLDLPRWISQQTEGEAQARLAAGIRPPDATVPADHMVADVYLSFRAYARVPEPAFATGNADTIDGIQPSRLLDAGLLQLVVRPAGDDRLPATRPAAELPDPVTPAALRDWKRLRAWTLTQPGAEPFSLPAGGALSEHITAGHHQDGSEVLLARLVIPLDLAGPQPAFDATVDLDQPPFRPAQDIRPYCYSTEELALLALDLRS